MSVVLQVRVNGGAPQTGGITIVSGDVVQLTAASKAEWGTPVARWEMYDFPLSFACPAGWSTDPSTGTYYYEGNADPPTFTADANWGKFILRLAATDAGVRQTDSTTGVRVLSAGGYRSIGRGEGGQWGGRHGRWVRELQRDIKDLAAAVAGGVAGVEAPTGSAILLRTAAGVGRVTGAQIETDTDADRAIKALRADATTRDQLTIDTTLLKVKGGAGESILHLLPDVDGDPFLAWITQSDDATANGLSLSVADLSLNTTTFAVSATGLCFVQGSSHKQTDASGNYSFTRTNGSALTEVYQNTIASVTSRIAQASSGAGKSRYILGGLGASGSANGVFVSGLENGNTVLGGEHWLACGSLVANVSDKVRFGTGTPGAMTSFLDVYQSASGTVTIDPRSNSISFPSHPTHQILTSAYALLRGPEMYHDVDTIHRRTTATTQIADSKCGTFGPIASATTTTVFSHTTTTARIYDVRATVVVTNDTDNEGAAYYLRASFKNIAGTVTQIGATQAIAADLEDAGQTGLSCTIDFSGTAIRVRLTTDATDIVNGSYVVDITERVQA